MATGTVYTRERKEREGGRGEKDTREKGSGEKKGMKEEGKKERRVFRHLSFRFLR